MELVDIEKELENLGCHTLQDGLGEVLFYQNFSDMLLTGTIQESEQSYRVTVLVVFFASISDEETCHSEEKLLDLEVSKTDIGKVFKRVEHLITYLNERFSREVNLLETLHSDIKDVNDVKVSVGSKLYDVFSALGIVLDCDEGYLDRKGMINLYVELESISEASAIVKISYAGVLKYQRYIDATNVDEEIKNIEKCVEVFKENFIDGQVLLEELRNF